MRSYYQAVKHQCVSGEHVGLWRVEVRSVVYLTDLELEEFEKREADDS